MRRTLIPIARQPFAVRFFEKTSADQRNYAAIRFGANQSSGSLNHARHARLQIRVFETVARAFVEMASDDEAQAAITQLNEYQLGGRGLTVNEARPKPASSGGFGGGGGDSRRRRSEPRW